MSADDQYGADALAAREPIVCSCGEPCQDNHGLCDACEQWVATLDGAA